VVPAIHDDQGNRRVYGMEVLIRRVCRVICSGWIAYTLCAASGANHGGDPGAPSRGTRPHPRGRPIGAPALGHRRRLSPALRHPATPRRRCADRSYAADYDTYLPVRRGALLGQASRFLPARLASSTRNSPSARGLFDLHRHRQRHQSSQPEAYAYSFDYMKRATVSGMPIHPVARPEGGILMRAAHTAALIVLGLAAALWICRRQAAIDSCACSPFGARSRPEVAHGQMTMLDTLGGLSARRPARRAMTAGPVGDFLSMARLPATGDAIAPRSAPMAHPSLVRRPCRIAPWRRPAWPVSSAATRWSVTRPPPSVLPCDGGAHHIVTGSPPAGGRRDRLPRWSGRDGRAGDQDHWRHRVKQLSCSLSGRAQTRIPA